MWGGNTPHDTLANKPSDVPVLSAAYIILANFSTSVAGAVAGGMWTSKSHYIRGESIC